MNKTYSPQEIEHKWVGSWSQNVINQSVSDPFYLLFAFAYPSGSGLHVGHVESKTALDILARYYRMQGKNVFFPVGWDAFGLPAENYAIKTGVHPAVTTKTAIDTFRAQIRRIGISYDWENEISTSHPEYYKWTQWLFLELFAQKLAYRGKGRVNWCPSCQTVLANEQVVDGHCERCGTQVIQKDMEQWYFKILAYKDELISGLDQVDWPVQTKQQQLNWIGKSKGLEINFTLKGDDTLLPIWTTYWETVFGTTFVVIAPEKFQDLDLMKNVAAKNSQAVLNYLEQAVKKTEEERKIGERDKTGVDTGLMLINPVNGHEVPLFIADYVLKNVGTGIVMGVPAHDQRDFLFAKKYQLPVVQVVSFADEQINSQVKAGKISYESDGVLINSGEFDGVKAWGEGKQKMAQWMIDQGFAVWQTTYKLRDWLISRQRYWGAPIPIVYDPEGKPHPVKKEHLPWLLPTDVDFNPHGESPLTTSREFIDRVERLYGKGWRPEFDTMDTFVDSSWYFLRYVDSRNESEFASSEQIKKWLPVDLYMIGPEHIVLHLLYARFFTKFLRDQGYLDFDEPFMKMRHQGMILGPDGKKMSKSKGNVINPDEVIEKYGADTLRVYEMFMGPLEADKPWSTGSVVGIYRFLSRVYSLIIEASTQTQPTTATEVQKKLHQTIKKVSSDIPNLKFNTSIAAMMEFINTWEDFKKRQGGESALAMDDILAFIKILSPFAPFLAEEMYHNLSKTSGLIQDSPWPKWNEQLIVEDNLTIVIQVNGKVRGHIQVTQEQAAQQPFVIDQAQAQDQVKKWLESGIGKVVYIRGKVVNFVTER